MDAFRKSLQIFTELEACRDVARLFSELGRSKFAVETDSKAEYLWRESLRLSLETHGISRAMVDG